MALGTDHTDGSGKDSGTENTFIPELWSDEVNATYKNSLVLMPLVKKISFVGKKGDSINIPKPVREVASAKAQQTQVTLVASAVSELVVTVNKHFEYSRLIEDITDVQALSSMRAFYTDDAGYALAVQVDGDVAGIVAGTVVPARHGKRRQGDVGVPFNVHGEGVGVLSRGAEHLGLRGLARGELLHEHALGGSVSALGDDMRCEKLTELWNTGVLRLLILDCGFRIFFFKFSI